MNATAFTFANIDEERMVRPSETDALTPQTIFDQIYAAKNLPACESREALTAQVAAMAAAMTGFDGEPK
jgi:hypothetical protein